MAIKDKHVAIRIEQCLTLARASNCPRRKFGALLLDPARNVTRGFETEKTGVGMPSYLGVLRDDQIDSIILYIKSLTE